MKMLLDKSDRFNYKMGLIPDNACYSLVMGVLGGIPATPENLMHQIKQLPEGAIWQSVVISRKQWQLDSLAAMMGGNIRVGLEDNFYLPNGDMATTNGALVEFDPSNLIHLKGIDN